MKEAYPSSKKSNNNTITNESNNIKFRNALNKYNDMKSTYVSLFETTSAYYILGVGTNNYLYYNNPKDFHWHRVNDNSNGQLIAIASTNSSKVLGVFTDNKIYEKDSWDSPNWNKDMIWGNDFLDVAVAPDNSMIGVTTIGTLNYLNPNAKANKDGVTGWQPCSGGYTNSIAVTSSNVIFCTNFGKYSGTLFKRTPSSFIASDINNSEWVKASTELFKGVATTTGIVKNDGYIHFIGLDNRVYKSSFNDLNNITRVTDAAVTNIALVAATDSRKEIIKKPSSSYITSDKAFYIKDNSTIDECSEECHNNDDCFGGMFNSSSNLCTLYNNEGNVTSSSNKNNTVLLKKKIQVLEDLENLNEKVSELNNKIIQEGEASKVELYVTNNRNTGVGENLQKQYNQLKLEREKYKKTKEELMKNNANVVVQDIKTNAYYSSFILLLILSIIIVIVIVNINSFGIVKHEDVGIVMKIGYAICFFITVNLLLIFFFPTASISWFLPALPQALNNSAFFLSSQENVI